MQRPHGGLRIVASNEGSHLLAMVEAEVGSLLELLPVAVLVTDETGKVLRANPAACVVLGVSERVIVGSRIDDLLLQSGLSVRVRTLCHAGQVLRLYVL